VSVWLFLVTMWLSGLVSELCCATTYLPYILFIGAYVQFVTSGHWIKVITLLCCVTLAYCLVKVRSRHIHLGIETLLSA